MTQVIRRRWIATVMCVVSLGTMAGVAACGGGDEGNADVTGDPSRPVVPSPIPTAPLTPNPPSPAIPDGVMPIEEVAARPAEDPDVRYQRHDGVDLPAHLSPCRTPLAGDRDRVAARQVVVAPTNREQVDGRPRVWKAQRLVVSRDTPAARRSVAELRDALARCATHDEGGGITTQWRSKPLAIGDEAFFVAGQMYRGETALHGHYRGVVMRRGRVVVTYLDFGPLTEPAVVSETEEQQEDARVMAERLATATWLDS